MAEDEGAKRPHGFHLLAVEMHNNAPARFNQMLSIHSHIVELKGASMTFKQDIINAQDQKLLVTVQAKIACVDLANMRPRRIPEAMLGEFSRVI